MNKWFYRAVGTVGVASGFLLLGGGAAYADQADARPATDPQQLRGALDALFTPLADTPVTPLADTPVTPPADKPASPLAGTPVGLLTGVPTNPLASVPAGGLGDATPLGPGALLGAPPPWPTTEQSTPRGGVDPAALLSGLPAAGDPLTGAASFLAAPLGDLPLADAAARRSGDRVAGVGPLHTAPPASDLPLDALATNGLPLDALPTGGLPLDALPTSGLPLNGLPTDRLPTDRLPTDGLPTDGLPTGGLPLDGLPTNGLPLGAAAGAPLAGLPRAAAPDPANITDHPAFDALPGAVRPTVRTGSVGTHLPATGPMQVDTQRAGTVPPIIGDALARQRPHLFDPADATGAAGDTVGGAHRAAAHTPRHAAHAPTERPIFGEDADFR